MVNIKEQTVLQRAQVVDVKVDEQLVMMNVNEGKYYGANEVGGIVWDLLKEPISFADLCQKIADTFDLAEAPNYQAELIAFLEELREKKLIECL